MFDHLSIALKNYTSVLDKLLPVPYEVIRQHVNDAFDALPNVRIIAVYFGVSN